MEGWKINQDPTPQFSQKQSHETQQTQQKWLIQNLQYTNTNYRPINSQSVIRNFHKQNKQTERAHVYCKKQLQEQVRKTTFKLKVKKFRKNINLRQYVGKYQCKYQYQYEKQNNSSNNNENGSINDQGFCNKKDKIEFNQKDKENINVNTIDNEKNDKYKIEHFNTFNDFIIKKRSENMHVKSKMKIFCNSITDRSRAKIQRKINSEIVKLQQHEHKNQHYSHFKLKPQRSSCTPLQQPALNNINSSSPSCLYPSQPKINRSHKIKQYTISHMILDKLLRIMIQNPKYISLKHQNQQIYQQMKQQMLDLIINNQRINKSIQMLENQMKLEDHSKFKFNNRNKFKTMQICRKPFYLLKQQKKDQLGQQINNILQTLKDIIQEAFINFNKPQQAYHLQQYWDHREGNNAAIQKVKKLNKTQNCLRTTTIQRFKQTKQI